jgi:RNA polymerase sigma factor (TIGR02999 family)
LEQVATGEQGAANRLIALVYDDFRALAATYLKGEPSGHTLQPTALVHEAYLRLVDQSRVAWQGRSQFLAVGAIVMRRILVDHARSKAAEKRGARTPLVALSEGLGLALEGSPDDILDVERALQKLAKLDPRQAQIVELRVFAGMTVEEVAEAIGVSARTVDNEWKMVRAWLRRELKRAPADR